VIESSRVLEETSIPSKTDQLKKTYSNNKRWKNKFFFALGDWEFAPSEVTEGPRVPQETSFL
jgi:hypothetical protein